MALASERDPVIAGAAGFTEGVVRERHGDGGVGGMAGAEDVVDAAKPMLGVEGVHAWGRDLVALDGREVVNEEIAAALPHHVDIEDGGGHVFADPRGRHRYGRAPRRPDSGPCGRSGRRS